MILPLAPIRTVLAAPRSRLRSELRAWLRSETDIRIVGEAPNGPAAVRLIERAAPDLAFLHVDLPRLDGFGVLDALTGTGAWPPPAVVMVSVCGLAAVRAFHVRATDFLQVPFDVARLRRSLDRVRRLLWSQPPRPGSTSARPEPTGDRLALRSHGRVFFVGLGDLLWARADRRRTEVHLTDSVKTVEVPFGQLLRRLPERSFVRVNRSTLVRQDYIREIHSKSHGDRWVILEDGQRVVLSRSRRREVLRRF